MDSTAHGANAFWLYYIIYFMVWGSNPIPPSFMFWIVLFGNVPDLDGIYWAFKNKKFTADNNFQHHLYFASHWPITYFPLIIISILSMIFNFYPEFFLIPLIGVYTHLLSDSACCGDGMMWKKNPWNDKQFAPFINYFSSKTDGYHGSYWSVRWRKTLMYKISILNGILIILFQIYYMINIEFSIQSFWNILLIVALSGSMVIGALNMGDKFKEEPPNGRYNDYRKNKDYLKWMEKNGYELNLKMKVVKVKKNLRNQVKVDDS